MNWTGGHLQRPKANANTLVKTQKQHFAKARPRLENGCSSQAPFAFFISHGPCGHNMEMSHYLPIDDYHRHRKRPLSQETFQEEHTNGFYSPSSSHHHNLGDESRLKRRRPERLPDSGCDGVPATVSEDTRHVQKTKMETSSGQTSMADHNRKSVTAKANTLQNAKRSLLKKSDWMGLSAARPLKMAFATVQEMESIGKRRKITETDGRRKAVALQDSESHLTTNRHRHMSKNRSNTSIPHTKDASIRIGGDIHQTQTTSLLTNGGRPTPDGPVSASTESMLLDKFDLAEPFLDQRQSAKCASPLTGNQPEHSPKISVRDEAWPALTIMVRADKHEDSHFLSNRARASFSKGPSKADTERMLPTLDQLRNSKSFDEVKARSASGSLKALTFPSLSLFRPMPPKDVTRGGHGIDDSRSAVKCRRLLRSCEDFAQSASRDCGAEQKLSNCEEFTGSLPARHRPKKVSSGLRHDNPSKSKSQANLQSSNLGRPSNVKEQSILSTKLDMSTGRTTAHETAAAHHGRLRKFTEGYVCRPVFTLEQQASSEATAKSQMDASQSSTFDFRMNEDSIPTTSSTTTSNRSWIRSPPRPSQEGSLPHHMEPLHSRPAELAASRTPTRLVSGPGSKSFGTIGTKIRGFNLLNGTMQTPHHTSSKAVKHQPVTPSQFRATTFNGVPRTRRVRPDNSHPGNTQCRLSWWGAKRNRRADENEVSMQPLAPCFDELENRFEFEPILQQQRPNGEAPSPQNPLEDGEKTRLDGFTWRPRSTRALRDTSPAKTIHTSANTILYRAEDLQSSQSMTLTEPSETDFLTQMSPMEEKLDERLVDISVYTNVAQSVRSYIPASSLKTRSPRFLQNGTDVARGYVSGLHNAPFRYATHTAFPGVHDTDVSGQELRSPRHEYLPSSRSTHRQPLQAWTELPVIPAYPFTWTPQAKTGAPLSGNFSPSGISQLSFQATNAATETRGDVRTLRTLMRSTSPFPLKYVPIRERPQDSESDTGRTASADHRNYFPAFSTQRANDSLFEGMKHDQTAQSSPVEHEPGLQNGRTPTAPRSHDSGTCDEYPFADEEALHRISIDLLGTYSGSSISATATATPSLFLDNIHTRTNQPFIFAKPKPSVGIQGTRGRRDDDWIIGRITRRNSVVGKLKMSDESILLGDSVADDTESASHM
jgi:hypothetical protein